MLKDFVDEFIIVESPTTFSGDPKPIYALDTKVFYDPIPTWPKVKVWEASDDFSEEEIEEARSSPNTQGVDRWMNEFLQKEQLKKALIHLKDDDIVMVGDVDELYTKEATKQLGKKLKLRVYSYYLNLRSNEEFWGTYVNTYGNIKNECLNHLRVWTDENKTDEYFGWHFTNMGGIEAVQKKVIDQYNPDVFGSWTWDNLPTNFGEKDYIGRNFELKEDESELPQYLLDNKEKYKHLFKERTKSEGTE